jgi:hypothetical protein
MKIRKKCFNWQYHFWKITVLISILFSISIVMLSAPYQESEDLPLASQRINLLEGPDGKPLPFQNNSEIEEFLKTAKVKSTETVETGVNQVKKILLEHNGIQMNAVYRDVNISKARMQTASGLKLNFRDNCRYECAAYALSKLLGLDNIPPTVVRKIGRNTGTIQIWIEQAKMESERLKEKISPPDMKRWGYQMQTMHLFDNLVANDDRNQGNLLIDEDWKVWLIDHTRAFRTESKPPRLEKIRYCDEEVWRNLQGLDDDTIKESLEEYLRNSEVQAVLKRRAVIVEHIQAQIAKRGENIVLFSLF